MKRPLLIYLDSKDYSKLSDPKLKEDAHLSSVRRFLEQETAAGRIEVSFSVVHMVEACHRSAESHQLAIERAGLIDGLSGKRVMRYFSDIVTDEYSALVQASSRDVALDDDGRWGPHMDGFGDELAASLLDGIKQAIGGAASNRAQRRLLKKTIGTSDNPRLRAISQLMTEDMVRAHAQKFGVSQRFIRERILARMIENIGGESALKQQFLEEVFHPVRFVANYIGSFDKGGKLRHSVSSDTVWCNPLTG